MAENVFIVRLPFSWSFFLASDYLFSLHTLGKSVVVNKHCAGRHTFPINHRDKKGKREGKKWQKMYLLSVCHFLGHSF